MRSLLPHVLGGFGVQLYWMAQAWSAQLLVVLTQGAFQGC